MSQVFRGRHMAEIDGDFVVLLIGARLNLRHPVQTFKDLGGRRGGMKPMLDYLVAHPEKGLLGYTMGYPVMVQYWRSFEHLEAFARDDSDPHTLTWRNYWRRVGTSQGTGIWHETYLIRAGDYETIYANMPAFGLGAATRLVPAARRPAPHGYGSAAVPPETAAHAPRPQALRAQRIRSSHDV